MNNEEPFDTSTDGIAIIGMSGRFPGASTLERFWRNLHDGVESLTTFTHGQLLSVGEDRALIDSPAYVKAAMVLDGIDLFDADFFGFTPREAEITNPEHRIFLECAWEALEDAGYDPARYDGRIGVFGGAGMRCSYRGRVMSNPHLAGLLGDLQRFIAVDKDFLTTGISYRLNLRGPSVSIQTACSTSLVAVHLGCQSLLHGESDMVLAGGVSVRIPQIAGYLFQEGSIYSPDGHCRAFDATAKGTIFGSGAGVVLLKRLADALSDGDCIRAVIRSSCINNDGSLKMGYTAPSVDGQAAVVAEAHAVADVSGDEITYVETHGTGTPLGDPIEIAALTKAFRRTTPNKGFCAIGSLKTNIGHLDAAAGVAGLIKVVLALEHRMLPPSLNFSEANPEIDFASSPFYVQRTLSEWQPANGQRIAGVSSFGIGGTNAHVIIEEAPPTGSPDLLPRWQLLPISAKTASALDSATTHLGEFLAGHRDYNLADVAWTLQQGRKPFAYRRVMAANGVDDAIKLLQSKDPKRVHSSTSFEGDASVAFLFPAQGSQYVNMGRDLYEAEPVFRERVDFCAEHLRPLLGLDLRELLSPADKDVEEASEQLRQTRYTQPAMFTVDYGLARLWMSWGIMPSAMVGHSLGEYVAATVSGVFGLEDALTLVAERGRMMQELPPGAMLAVHLSEDELQPWLSEDVSLAAVNAPGLSAVSGPVEAIGRLKEIFHRQDVDFQPLRTSHAFHSAMMEPIVAALVQRVAQVPRHPPAIPFVSTLTGTWITADEASDPGYWGRQARYAVRFLPAVEELLKTTGRVLLEVGPGTTLSSLAKLQSRGKAPCTAVNSLRHAQGGSPDLQSMLSALGILWTAGVAVDWGRLHTGESRRRVPLPTYPFERKRFWIDAPQVVSPRFAESATGVEGAPRSASDVSAKNGHFGATSSQGNGLPTLVQVSLHSRPDLPNEYIAPQTDLEKMLASLWQEFFGIDQIGTHDNFFDLGGTSLIAAQLHSKIQKSLKCKLSLDTFVRRNPTIEGMARVIEEQQAQGGGLSTSPASSLIPIQTEGSTPPLFLLHGIGGAGFSFLELIRHLDPHQRIYGFESATSDSTSAMLSMEDLATRYIREIRHIQPEGPYYLLGYSFGGLLAFEMAQQLHAMGQLIGFLGIVDTPAPIRTAKKTALALVAKLGRFLRARDRLSYSRDAWSKLTVVSPQRRALVYARTVAAGQSLPHLPDHASAVNWFAAMRYRASRYPGGVHLFRAMSQEEEFDRTLGWEPFAGAGVEVHEVAGTHNSIMQKPNVESLARQVTACLSFAQGRGEIRVAADSLNGAQNSANRQANRIALVTGANKGIGFEVARCLAKAGLTVFLGARDQIRGQTAAATLTAEALDVRFIELDLVRPATIEAAAAHIATEFQRLDVLVNNAGISDSADGTPSTADLSAVRRVMETNFFGTLAVTQAMLPLLRKSAAARIVNVSSGLGSLELNADSNWQYAPVKLIGYSASKAAINMLTIQLADELRGTTIKVNASNPGYTGTDLNKHRGHQTVAQGAAETVRLALLPADGPTGGFFETAGPDPW